MQAELWASQGTCVPGPLESFTQAFLIALVGAEPPLRALRGWSTCGSQWALHYIPPYRA